MGYCFMTTQKIKSIGQLSSKYIHNYREIEIQNADPSLRHLNDTLVCTKNEYGEQLNYADAWKQRMEEIPKYRKNAVLAIEVVTTFSREENIDIEAWKQKNKEWLEKTFNVAPDGKNNVIDVIYHADEPGNVHCHAIVIPVDEKGNLNASRFLDGSKKLTEMQTDYAKDMEEFGLERGLQGGHASHRDIKKYYADLNNTLAKLPKPQENETAYEYFERELELLQTLQASAKRERDKKEQEMNRKLAEKRIKQENYFRGQWEKLNNMKKEIERQTQEENKELLDNIKKQKEIIEINQKSVEQLEFKKNIMLNDIENLEQEIISLENVKQKVQFSEQFQNKFRLLQEQEPERAQKFKQEMQYISQLQEKKSFER